MPTPAAMTTSPLCLREQTESSNPSTDNSLGPLSRSASSRSSWLKSRHPYRRCSCVIFSLTKRAPSVQLCSLCCLFLGSSVVRWRQRVGADNWLVWLMLLVLCPSSIDGRGHFAASRPPFPVDLCRAAIVINDVHRSHFSIRVFKTPSANDEDYLLSTPGRSSQEPAIALRPTQ